MNREERTVLIATIGLVLTASGLFLPWARVGGRNRSGLNTADTFINLASGALPDAIAWVGRWWYLPAFLAVIAWATTFARSHWALRTIGVAFALVSAAMWWLFVWAGQRYNVLNVKLLGPIVATLGLAAIGYACGQQRQSMLRPSTPVRAAGRPEG